MLEEVGSKAGNASSSPTCVGYSAHLCKIGLAAGPKGILPSALSVVIVYHNQHAGYNVWVDHVATCTAHTKYIVC